MLREEKEALIFYIENDSKGYFDSNEKEYMVKLIEADIDGD